MNLMIEFLGIGQHQIVFHVAIVTNTLEEQQRHE